MWARDFENFGGFRGFRFLNPPLERTSRPAVGGLATAIKKSHHLLKIYPGIAVLTCISD